MIALAAALASAAPVWVPVGESYSRLRVFVDSASIRDRDGHRRARVRIGAPTAITGRIVLAYEDEEFDCAAHRWRLLGYEARDEGDRIVRKTTLPADTPMLPAVDDSIGGAVAKLVCAAHPTALPSPR